MMLFTAMDIRLLLSTFYIRLQGLNSIVINALAKITALESLLLNTLMCDAIVVING